MRGSPHAAPSPWGKVKRYTRDVFRIAEFAAPLGRVRAHAAQVGRAGRLPAGLDGPVLRVPRLLPRPAAGAAARPRAARRRRAAARDRGARPGRRRPRGARAAARGARGGPARGRATAAGARHQRRDGGRRRPPRTSSCGRSPRSSSRGSRCRPATSRSPTRGTASRRSSATSGGVARHRPAATTIDGVAAIYVPLTRPIPPGGGVTPTVLPAVRVASVLHRGRYEGLPAAEAALERWTRDAGLRVAGPVRTLYVQFGAEAELRVPRALPRRPRRRPRHGAPAPGRVTYAWPMPRKRAAAAATPVPAPWPRPAKIAFIGSHGIRKTSALLAFAAEVQRAGRSVELGREVVRDNPLGINEGATGEAQLWVLVSQVRQELELARKADVLATDRGVMDNYAYYLRACGGTDEFAVYPLVQRWSQTYDHVVRLLPDVALQADGVRSTNDAFRDEVEAILDRVLPELVPADRMTILRASEITSRFDWFAIVQRLATIVGAHGHAARPLALAGSPRLGGRLARRHEQLRLPDRSVVRRLDHERRRGVTAGAARGCRVALRPRRRPATAPRSRSSSRHPRPAARAPGARSAPRRRAASAGRRRWRGRQRHAGRPASRARPCAVAAANASPAACERRRRRPDDAQRQRLDRRPRLRRGEHGDPQPAARPAQPPRRVGGRPRLVRPVGVRLERPDLLHRGLHRRPAGRPRLVEVDVHRERAVRDGVVPAARGAPSRPAGTPRSRGTGRTRRRTTPSAATSAASCRSARSRGEA